MIVSKRRSGFTFVPQYEHGVLAGELAANWGNAEFAASTIPEALRLAATHHDDGWRELDDLPAYNEEAGRPAHFLELPLERIVPAYGRGVDSVYERDPLAGALVGMHWTGLYSGRWGLAPVGTRSGHPLAEQVVAEQERRRGEILLDVWRDAGGPRSEFEASVWHAYEVLQALDLISLGLSLLDPATPTDRAADPVPLPGILFAIEQPPGARLLPAIPTGPLGEHVELTMLVAAPGVATLDPWPFGPPQFEVSLPARTLPAEDLAEAAGVAAFQEAPLAPIRWTVTAPR